MGDVLAFSILAVTVGLSLGRPRLGWLKIDHASAAVTGALLALLLGVVSLDTVYETVQLLSFPIITIVSLMIITLTAERAGMLDLLAHAIARVVRGNGRHLFTYLFFCGTIAGTIFTNDAAVLLFTPLVFDLIEDVQEDDWQDTNKVPYYFAILYVANLVATFVISNPINIIVASLFDIGFVEYALWMFLPAVVSVVVSYVGLRIVFRNTIPQRYNTQRAAPTTNYDRRFLVICNTVLGLTLLGFFSESFTGIPTWLVACTGAITLLIVQQWKGDGIVPVVKGVGWDVIVFVIGMFIIAMGLRNVGLTHYIGTLISNISGGDFSSMTFATGFISAICSSVINNHPMAGIMAWVVRDAAMPALETKMLVFAALIGGDLGPKMLPIGSLAALMWFRILRNKGVHISYTQYIVIGVPVTLIAILLALLTVHAEFVVYQWIVGA
ncbi:MAG: arsenical efflux pump membrane protein ArsB [Chloroflexi bacterium AL-W]|nr:arsenical efflux pump membrane protein ArsB [Chloroflexi bacterium AL-N1]NOK70853.1 arsenical efflux pump membrane protein ArsB [Chloroflexi bacterium AL-N10]NOK78413.1 arsenical efflux pump membrane protein ArsB [Chloroflexi bacterium AL-N5]NOK85394.1 arsenical efflux pump membrane protein ArsB [Chloroflexi bacterium AL-W]NOK92670.1 arsenical efflux pump membrane protein ArsB [Chloroflexi bacterium AL-N15]